MCFMVIPLVDIVFFVMLLINSYMVNVQSLLLYKEK